MTEKKRLYGFKILDELREEFRPYGYRPNHSELYKALHDLIKDGILKQIKRKKKEPSFKRLSIISLSIMKKQNNIKDN